MHNFTSIKNYHREMAKNGDFLDELFKKNRSNIPVKKEHALEMLGGDETAIEKLIHKNVIYEDQGQLFLYDNHRNFYESVLELPRELNNYLIKEYIERLTESFGKWARSTSERDKSKEVFNVRKTLMDIVNNVRLNLNNLNALLTEKYDVEPDFQERIRHLKRYDDKRKDVVQLIDTVNEMVNSDMIFFSNNEMLFGTVLKVKLDLTEYRKELTSYHSRILEHLNKIEKQQALVKKIRLLKHLKNNMLLETETNIHAVINQVDGMLFKKASDITKISTMVSVEYLRDDDDAASILENIRAEVAGRYSQNSRKTKEEKPVRLDVRKAKKVPHMRKPFDLPSLMAEFLHQKNDLFSFAMDYPFKEEADTNCRILLYVKLADRFIQKAIKEKRIDSLNLTEHNTFKNFKYIIIRPT